MRELLPDLYQYVSVVNCRWIPWQTAAGSIHNSAVNCCRGFSFFTCVFQPYQMCNSNCHALLGMFGPFPPLFWTDVCCVWIAFSELFPWVYSLALDKEVVVSSKGIVRDLNGLWIGSEICLRVRLICWQNCREFFKEFQLIPTNWTHGFGQEMAWEYTQ